MSAFIWRLFYYNTGVGDETQIAVVEWLQWIHALELIFLDSNTQKTT